MSVVNEEADNSGTPGIAEDVVMEVTAGQRFAGWWMQIFGVILLFISGPQATFWLGQLIGDVSSGEHVGLLIVDRLLYLAIGMLGVVIGAPMRAFGLMMRGSVRFASGQSFVWWALCSLGKIVCVFVGVGVLFGAVKVLLSDAHWLVSAYCMLVAGLLALATVRLHSRKSRFVRN